MERYDPQDDDSERWIEKRQDNKIVDAEQIKRKVVDAKEEQSTKKRRSRWGPKVSTSDDEKNSPNTTKLSQNGTTRADTTTQSLINIYPKEDFSGSGKHNRSISVSSSDSDSSSSVASDSSSSVPSSDSSSSAPSSESSDCISLKNETSGSNNIDPRARIVPKLVTVANALESSRTIDEGLADLGIENEDDVITSEQPEIKDPLSKTSSELNQTSPPLLSASHKNVEISTAFHMSKLPIRQAANIWGVAPFLVDNLERDNFDNFFPIQSLVVPDVIASERHAHLRTRDICVSAPTGSGKTLAFVLPVLNALSKRRVLRLRALVVLPSRDLAIQVHSVFNRYSEGSNLKIGLAIGQTDFAVEQKSLILGSERLSCKNFQKDNLAFSNCNDEEVLRYTFQPYNVRHALAAFNDGNENGNSSGSFTNATKVNNDQLYRGGQSAVDILVCTPGRLMDHLDKTAGFTLQHLQFLVIDEADRLVGQSYQNWIGRVLEASSFKPEMICKKHIQSKSNNCLILDPESTYDERYLQVDPVTWRREHNIITTLQNSGLCSKDYSIHRSVQLRKLLFSATMTKDPQKLESLGLVNPKHFDAHHLNMTQEHDSLQRTKQYSLPEKLSEFTAECSAQQKPMVLLALLLEQIDIDKGNDQKGIVVVFTSSLVSTHRLARLLQILWATASFGLPTEIAEFSSALSQKQRVKLIEQCNNITSNKIRIIVCSDGMSRGMDLTSVTAVINYDVPSFAKSYVHRCGRTARAGRKGRAITLLKKGQIGYFLKKRQLIENANRVKPTNVRIELVKDVIPVYQACVEALRNVIDEEENNAILPYSTLNNSLLPS